MAVSALAVVSFAAVATASTSTATSATEQSHSADDREGSRLHGQIPVVGFFQGRTVRYLDEGPVQLAKDSSGHFVSDVDPIWVVGNGAPGQRNIIDNVPGLNSPDDYTPLWQVVTVTWNVKPYLLRSAADVHQAETLGLVTLVTTDTIVNCPVLGFQQPVTKGFFQDSGVRYLDEGVTDLAKDATGAFVSDVDPIWAVTNGAKNQRNIIDNVPNLNNPDDYTPLWQVIEVTWLPGVKPTVLDSAAEVAHAAAEGLVTLVTTDTVVNCPVL